MAVIEITRIDSSRLGTANKLRHLADSPERGFGKEHRPGSTVWYRPVHNSF